MFSHKESEFLIDKLAAYKAKGSKSRGEGDTSFFGVKKRHYIMIFNLVRAVKNIIN